MNTDTDHGEPEAADADRYRAIEYQRTAGQVTIIQDTENEQAWIQSDVTADVSR